MFAKARMSHSSLVSFVIVAILSYALQVLKINMYERNIWYKLLTWLIKSPRTSCSGKRCQGNKINRSLNKWVIPVIVFKISLTSDAYMQQVAMCHVSEIADHYVKDVDKHYKVGDRVRAFVVKVCTVCLIYSDPLT